MDKTQHSSKKTLHNGLYAAALAVVVLAAVILVNLVVRALPSQYTEYDISTSGMFTLSDTTQNLLGELDTDVQAYYLAISGEEDANVTRLLDRYAGASSHFSWQQRDPVLYPTLAEQYDGASTGSVVLVNGDKYEVLSYYGDLYAMDIEAYYYYGTQQYSFGAENALTSALAKVTRTASYRLYELAGHGETALGSDFLETLDAAGVTVDSLNLVTAGSIPADASVVLINAPLADVTADEAALLQAYVDGGGKLLAVTDFTLETPNLDGVLASCGMTRQPGLLVETDGDHYPYGMSPTYLLPDVASNEILAGMTAGMMVYTPIAQGIVSQDDDAYTHTDLLTTSLDAYSLENYATAETAQKADTDPVGSFAVATAAENEATGARVVWINCPNALQTAANQSTSGGNAQFLGSIVNWCNGQQTTAVISAKSMSAAALTVPAGAIIGLGVLFVFVLPIVCLIAGAVVCLVRRRR